MRTNTSIGLRLAAAVALVILGGCVSLNPDHFLPTAITPAGDDQRFEGTLNVQAFAPVISRGKVNVASYVGSISGSIRVAAEQTLSRKELFNKIEQGEADYVLDIYVTDVTRNIKTFGEGYMIDMTTIWRLTRAADGAVIICDFANGHGASRAMGTNAFVQALETAVREMLVKGVAALSERKTPLAALYMARDWPSMGPAVPTGYRELKENLKKLHAGLTEAEVRALIPSMANAERTDDVLISRTVNSQFDSHTTIFKSPIYNQVFANGGLREVPVFFFPFRKLVFENDKLVQWELPQ